MEHVKRDSIDASHIESAAASPGYQLIAAELRTWIAAYEKQLRCCTPDELRPLQARIDTLERALQAPATITTRIRKGHK